MIIIPSLHHVIQEIDNEYLSNSSLCNGLRNYIYVLPNETPVLIVFGLNIYI